MSSDLRARLLAGALAHGGRAPESLVRAVAEGAALGARAAVHLDGSAFAQLRRNLARVRPELADPGSRPELDALVAENLRRYLRYYAEMVTVGRVGPRRLRARAEVRGFEVLADHLRRDRSAVVALGHLGNWDLAGAWLGLQDARLVTVAEHLEPEEVFVGFQRVRADLGMTVVPLDGGAATFRALVREARRPDPALVALLADRDLTRGGVRVDLLGGAARVAAGPAALARALDLPLHVAAVTHRPLHGSERVRAGARWGIEARVSSAIDTSGDVAEVTQRWVDVLAAAIRARPADWHMLQPVWEEDLDAARLRAPRYVSGRARALDEPVHGAPTGTEEA